MRHIVTFWLLFATLLSPTALSNQEQAAPKELLKEREKKQKAFCEKMFRARDLARKVLPGRQIIVRIYYDWKEDPGAFKLVSVKLNGLLLGFSRIASAYSQMPESAVIAVTGIDQEDQAVAAVIGDFIHAAPYKKKGSFSLWTKYFDDSGHKWWTFNDALGNPIPNADVELLIGEGSDKNPRISIGRDRLDEKGRLKPPKSTSQMMLFTFVVSHPDYGTALVEPQLNFAPDNPPKIYTVPIVPIGTKADERTIRGVVVDTENNPVKGAIIECLGLETLGGGYISILSKYRLRPYRVRTEENGFFVMYLPIGQNTEKHGSLIPLASKYSVKIKAPKHLGLRNFSGAIRSGRDTIVTMLPVEPDSYFHCFLFEDETGPVTDPNKLKKIRLDIKRSNTTRSFGYDQWKDGGIFPLGTYRAVITEPKTLIFETVEVTDDTPELLLFKPRTSIVHFGQVIHGITDRPMAGVFVFAGHMLNEDFSVITPEQWHSLHSLPANPSLNDPNLEPLLKISTVKKIIRTDRNGSFEVSLPPGSEQQDIVAFEENYLGIEHRRPTSWTQVESVENLTMKLFPASTVIVEPNIPIEVKRDSILFRFHCDPNDNPPWLKSFWSCYAEREISVICKDRLQLRELHSVHVPAGLKMNIVLHLTQDKRWCPIIFPDVRLEQGQTLNLGQKDFQPTLRVSVKVIDSKGDPVEGVSVRGPIMGWRPITDSQGLATLYVTPHSSGRFIVQYVDISKRTSYMEDTPYEVRGEEDLDRLFTLQLSDEMISYLFK